MYTLEDDQETSSRLKKDQFTDGEPQPGTFAGAEEAGAEAQVVAIDQQPTGPHHLSLNQITSSMKKLTTPDAGTAGAVNPRVALAALTIACIGVFFTALDQTVVVTALPQIITDLQIPITQLDHASWIISAYLLGFIVAMPLMGRVSDIYGRRRIFLFCLTIFGVGSIFCGLAPLLGKTIDLSFLSLFDVIGLHIDTSSPGLVFLITARLFQAIGGGAIVPIAMAIAGDFYGQKRRELALGIIGAMTEAGGALGPLYGAIIVQRLGWQWIFYLNVPLVIGLMVGAWFLIPRGRKLKERIDWIGAVLLGIALTCLSLGLAQQGTSLGPASASGQAPQNNPIALALAVAFLIAFVVVEWKVRWPVVDLSLFKRFAFSASALASLFVGAALIIAMADIPIFVDTVLQGKVLDSGLALLRLTAMIPIGALLGGWLSGRISCRVTGVLGLLFMATGFYLMSRWPIHLGWQQMTISTMTAGFGFGLVIAPISTTAINAVRARQVGMSSAVVTALRMVGMMLGLAALTSWALAYFKDLARQYPTLPATATAAQFTQWSKGYAQHLIQSAHTVYCSVFFMSMVLCLLAIIPAIFLWGRKPPVSETEPEPEPTPEMLAAAGSVTLIDDPAAQDTQLPAALTRGRNRKKRRIVLASVGLVLLLVVGGITAAFMLAPDDDSDQQTGSATTLLNSGNTTGTAQPASGPRMIQLALDKAALTSVFVSQLNLQQGTLSDLNVTPLPNDVLALSLNLHIDTNGLHRVMPVELDGKISVDNQQNIQLQVYHVRRDGNDAGPAAAANMQAAMNQLLASAVMPALRGHLQGVQLMSVHTSSTLSCGKGAEMLVLLVKAPPIQGVAAQPTPMSFCFSGPVDLNKLLPH